MIKAGILGATGYMGGEALRILLEHPQVEVAWATCRRNENIAEANPNLFDCGIQYTHPDNITPCDVIFFALPSGLPMKMAQDFLNSGHKLIDLGSDFRLENKDLWEKVYKKPHTAQHLISEAPYGIAELYREKIQSANIVANPGCFSSAAILGLAPLAKNTVIDMQKIVIDGISGTSGAGAELHKSMHHPEIGNNLVPYNVTGHRHTYEIEQELSKLSQEKTSVHFTTTYAPITRGILDICHVFPKNPITREEVMEIFTNFYKNEPFIKIYNLPKDPETSWQYKPYPPVNITSGTNYCYIGVDVDEERQRIVVFSVLDSVGKGGAHAGVQNMNIMFGIEETTGLLRRGMHPA